MAGLFVRSSYVEERKKYVSLKITLLSPPQHETLICFLDVDSLQGGSFNLSENISDLISFIFYFLNSPQGKQASILSFVDAVVAVRRQMLNSPPSRVF